MGNNKVILLFSGGIDSTVLLFWLKAKNYEIYPLLVNYGQNSFEGEYKSVIQILEHIENNNLFILEIPNLRSIGGGSLVGEYPLNLSNHEEWYKSEFFPNRNMILLSLAASYAYKLKASKIAIGLVGESYKDTSKVFLDEMEKVIEQSFDKFDFIAPFTGKTRLNVVQEAVNLQVPIKLTFSCNSLGNRHCLLCTSCYEREEAIKLYEIIEESNRE